MISAITGRHVQLDPLSELTERVVEHLERIYPDENTHALAKRFISAMDYGGKIHSAPTHTNLWTERDAVVICYGNSCTAPNEAPLATLARVLHGRTEGLFSMVHLLPFFPYSSDDGFSVINYRQVNESLGGWEDITRFSKQYRLMGDLVMNHCSARSQWFLQYADNQPPGAGYFIEMDDIMDVSQVVRPRSSPLAKPVRTLAGEKFVWCTFSHDQVDLNYANPETLLEMVGIIAFYLDQGISIFRLDAVAYIWKVIGTSCVNLPETHEIIRLLRTLVERRAPEAILITETNLPNRENLSYFGNANEAHWIYNFTLPPLVLHALTFGRATYLNQWMMSMPPAQDGTAYLNFVTSHDGIGLRPAEGILPEAELEALVTTMKTRGGLISSRELDGRLVPYELNISLYSACADESGCRSLQRKKFLLAHAIMFGLEGVPAVYFPSLFSTENATHRVEATAHNRAINRPAWTEEEANAHLEAESEAAQFLDDFKSLMAIRRRQPAFHPNATQFTLHLGDPVFAFWRQSRNREQSIFCLHNLSGSPIDVPQNSLNLIDGERWIDLLSDEPIDAYSKSLLLAPYQSCWITNWNHCAEQT